MQSTVTCRSCGTVLGIPKGGVPVEGVTCNWCGAVTTPDAPKPTATKAKSPAPPAAATLPAKPKTPLNKYADDEDDDGLPYDIPADEITTKPCVGCHKQMDTAAVVCVHCGQDQRGGKKAERVYSPIDKTWEQGWPFARRMTVFLAFQALSLVTTVISLSVAADAPAAFTAVLTFTFLQAFVLGTYPRLRVRRNKKGQAELMTTWRVCFIPLATKKVDWRRHEGVSVGVYDGTGITDLWMFFTLLTPFVIPGIVWWWYAIRADRYFTALTLQSGALETYLYRGLREDQAKDIAQTITDATGLTLNTPL